MQPDAELYPWISVAAIAWGLLDCFFGYRVFKVTLALLGGILGAWFCHMGALAMGLGPMGQTIALIAGGLLGALLAFLLYIGAVFVAGFGFGATLGLLLLSNVHHMVALLSGCVLGVIGGFLAVKVQRVLIVLSTALLGAFRSVLALAYFTSHLDWLFHWRHPDQMPALLDNNPWMLPSVIGLAVVGVIAQLEIGGGSSGGGKKKSKEKKD